MVPGTVCTQNHQRPCKAISQKPKYWGTDEDGEQAQGIKIPNNIEITSFSWISKLTSSWASADLHDFIDAPGLKRPWIQTSAKSHYYMLTRLWHGHGLERLHTWYHPASSSWVLTTTHSTAYPRDSPEGTRALQASYAIIPSTAGFVYYEQPHRKQSGWREQNWKGADTIKAALPTQRQTSQKFSV